MLFLVYLLNFLISNPMIELNTINNLNSVFHITRKLVVGILLSLIVNSFFMLIFNVFCRNLQKVMFEDYEDYEDYEGGV